MQLEQECTTCISDLQQSEDKVKNWGYNILAEPRITAFGGLLRRQGPNNGGLGWSPQQMNNVCYLTISFNFSIVHIRLDYIVCVHGWRNTQTQEWLQSRHLHAAHGPYLVHLCTGEMDQIRIWTLLKLWFNFKSYLLYLKRKLNQIMQCIAVTTAFTVCSTSDVVLETKVLVLRRLKDKK